MFDYLRYKTYLKAQWSEAHAALNVRLGEELAAEEAAPNWRVRYVEFDRVMAAYRGRGRHYHAVAHIFYGLHTINSLVKSADPSFTMREIALLKLAFFYHDVVYNVFESDNELLSAEQARAYLSALGVPAPEIDRVVRLIVETVNHQASTCTDPLWPVMNDADLAVIAAPASIYRKYANKVWKEYSVRYLRKEFVVGRKDFVDRFSKKPIFRTPQMQKAETQARANLAAEWRRLSAEELKLYSVLE